MAGLTGADLAAAAGGTGGAASITQNGGPDQTFTGGNGGSASGGSGGSSNLAIIGNGTTQGGAGGTAYKGVGNYVGTGGGGGGTFSLQSTNFPPIAITATGGAGGGIGQSGNPASIDINGNAVPSGIPGAAGADPAPTAQLANGSPITGQPATPVANAFPFGGAGGGAGGAGAIVVGAGPSSNSSSITGGAGGTGEFALGGGGGGAGGIGVLFSADGASFGNNGSVTGGAGGVGEQFAGGGGLVFGGGGGGAGGTGVLLLGAGSSVTNFGAISGGAGGAGTIAPDSTALASGGGGEGGVGALFVGDGSRLVNGGIVTGGVGGDGASVALIASGGGGGGGGIGALFVGSGASATNTGQVAGGAGGTGYVANLMNGGGAPSGTVGGGGGGEGGVGIQFTGAQASLVNGGSITGGVGGSGGGFPTATIGGGGGGDGGVGALFSAPGARVTNTGLIVGGNGGSVTPDAGLPVGANATVTSTPGTAGAGGIGIVANGITIDNSGGTIAGGFANNGAGPQAYAIKFTGGTNYVGIGGTINGGIYVMAGSFQPSLPGSRVGTPLAVNGPIAFAPGSFYNVRVRPQGNDRVNVTGTATLTGATVNVLAGQGTYQSGRRTILSAAGGLGGTTFAGVTTNLAFLRPRLGYDGTNVFLTLTGGGNYGIAAITYNQIAVAGGLTNAASQNPGGDGRRILNALNQLTAPQARAAFDALSGEGVTGAQNVAFRSTQLFTSSIFDQTTFYAGGGTANSITLTERVPGLPAFLSLAPTERAPIRELADLPASRVEPAVAVPVVARTWRAWATGWGGTEHISGNAFPIGSATQNNSLYGGSLGVDYQLLPNYLVGVAVGGSNGDFRVDQRGTFGTTTGGHIAIYDLLTLGNWYGASSSSFSYFGNKTTRFVSGFGGLGSETLRGNFDSNEFRSRLEIGRHFSSLPLLGGLPAIAGFGTVTPFVALELASLRSNGFTEYATRGAGLFRLNVSGQSIGSAPAYAGLRFQRITPLGNGMVLSPTLQLAYVHEFAPYRNQIGTLANLPGSTFLVDGARPARDAAQVKAGAELAIGSHSAIFANFDGEFSGINQLYAGKGGFRYVW